MSIIQEALKKAQGTYVNKAAEYKPAAKPEVIVPVAVTKTHHKPSAMPILAPGLIILTVIIGFGLKSYFSPSPVDKTAGQDNSHTEVSYAAINTKTGTPDKDSTEADSAKITTTSNIAASLKNSIPTAFISGQAPNLTLNGIMYLKESPRAIINGNMVGEGDSVSGAKVTAISRNNVILNYNSTEINLKLKE